MKTPFDELKKWINREIAHYPTLGNSGQMFDVDRAAYDTLRTVMDKISQLEASQSPAVTEVKELPDIDGWISVKDSKPKDGERIIVWDSVQGIGEAHYVDRQFDYPYYGQEISGSFNKVTYWMPLPNPPKK